MKSYSMNMAKALSCALLLAPALAFAFDSGSTGADGAFSPTVNTVLQLPPDGVFNYTSVNIPTGVTVTFKKNVTNTPVVILASGDITIAGTLSVGGSNSTPTGAAGDGNTGDDGLPGRGGPGGYDGGQGGKSGVPQAGNGLGPGGGTGGFATTYYFGYSMGGGGAGHNGNGGAAQCWNQWCKDGTPATAGGQAGLAYGTSLLLPLIGGSGGGGGYVGSTFGGSGGGGGGGAILLAASGTVTVNGTIAANGGASGELAGAGHGATGGGGSGGAIRIVATTIAGNGPISAAAGGVGAAPHDWARGGNGAAGRIRLESEFFKRTAGTTPQFTTGEPGPVFVSGMPSLKIASVAGVAAPASPTGSADITLPSTTANPVTVVFQTTNVPVGNTVKLTVAPATGAGSTVISPALSGTTESASTSVSVNLPKGASVLQAQTTYTIVAAMGDMMSTYANNERVEQIELIAGMDGRTVTNLITVSGKRYEASPEALAMLSRIPVFGPRGS